MGVLTRVGNVPSHTLSDYALIIASLRASIDCCASYPHSTRVRLCVKRINSSAIVARRGTKFL